MVGKCIAQVKSHTGKYYSYEIEFKSEKHFNNWYNSIAEYGKVIGVFEDTTSHFDLDENGDLIIT